MGLAGGGGWGDGIAQDGGVIDAVGGGMGGRNGDKKGRRQEETRHRWEPVFLVLGARILLGAMQRRLKAWRRNRGTFTRPFRQRRRNRVGARLRRPRSQPCSTG